MPEIEAKFLVQRPKQLQSVIRTLRELGFTINQGPSEALQDSYFDTPDWVIFRAGLAYRCRQKGDSKTLALKALSGGRGPVFARDEIEQPLPHAGWPGGELPDGPVSERLQQIINGHRSHELFRVRTERTLYQVSGSNDDPVTMELALDRSEILTQAPVPGQPPQTLSFTELELELEEGSREALTTIARNLSERTGLLPAQLSKFERGLYAARLEPPQTPPEEHHFTRDHRLLDLAYDRLGRQFTLVKRQAPRAWEGLEPESVHRMRVAIRRIRAMLRALRDMAPDDVMAGFNREFRWLSTALGNVRDADVQNYELHGYLDSLHGAGARELTRYARQLEKQRRKARAGLINVLSSQRYDELISTFQRFVEAGRSPATLQRAGDLSIGVGADALLLKATDKLLRSGRGIRNDSDPEKLHALRIQTKRARYLLECFNDCYENRLEALLAGLRRLQNVLGDYQDTFIACGRLQTYAASRSTKKANRQELLALGCLLQIQREHAEKARGRFPKAWRRCGQAVVEVMRQSKHRSAGRATGPEKRGPAGARFQ